MTHLNILELASSARTQIINAQCVDGVNDCFAHDEEGLRTLLHLVEVKTGKLFLPVEDYVDAVPLVRFGSFDHGLNVKFDMIEVAHPKNKNIFIRHSRVAIRSFRP